MQNPAEIEILRRRTKKVPVKKEAALLRLEAPLKSVMNGKLFQQNKGKVKSQAKMSVLPGRIKLERQLRSERERKERNTELLAVIEILRIDAFEISYKSNNF